MEVLTHADEKNIWPLKFCVVNTLLWFSPQNFISDNTACSYSGVFEGEKAVLLNEVICEHLLRQGRLDIAEELIKVGRKKC